MGAESLRVRVRADEKSGDFSFCLAHRKGITTMAKEVISKTILVDKVAEAAGVSKKDTKAVIDALLETVKDSVKADAEIRLIGFGTFKKAHRNARSGRNPQTGETIEIAASDSLAFKSSVKY